MRQRKPAATRMRATEGAFAMQWPRAAREGGEYAHSFTLAQGCFGTRRQPESMLQAIYDILVWTLWASANPLIRKFLRTIRDRIRDQHLLPV
ncbi:hypothetical protein HMN09_01423300 [Mycena chlorophos]|uniref:Uncharacterized protein n=1 Tax=Mycena chlorophos TaxID=658473 RepID=A0A8H6RWE6_MYCCL|nr:hypothetical protein HMN09_01423300 [Mycena chlorophos]